MTQGDWASRRSQLWQETLAGGDGDSYYTPFNDEYDIPVLEPELSRSAQGSREFQNEYYRQVCQFMYGDIYSVRHGISVTEELMHQFCREYRNPGNDSPVFEDPHYQASQWYVFRCPSENNPIPLPVRKLPEYRKYMQEQKQKLMDLPQETRSYEDLH